MDLVQTDENRFELDLVLIANPDDALLIAPYFLEVRSTITSLCRSNYSLEV